jgi:hypothetical protein
MASGLYSLGNLSDISETVAGRGEKMKDCAVVPQIVSSGFQIYFGDVRDEPMDTLSRLA